MNLWGGGEIFLKICKGDIKLNILRAIAVNSKWEAEKSYIDFTKLWYGTDDLRNSVTPDFGSILGSTYHCHLTNIVFHTI